MTEVMLEDDVKEEYSQDHDHPLFGDDHHPSSWLGGAQGGAQGEAEASAAAALRPWAEANHHPSSNNVLLGVEGHHHHHQHPQHSVEPKDEETFQKLQKAMEIIRTNESHQSSSFDSGHCLIQVWYPDKTNRLQNTVVSTTTHQSENHITPQDCEAVSSTLSHFGERSKLFKFKVEGGLAEGLPGRVFVSGRPEMTMDVQQYGKENYLRIDEAVTCGIKAAVGIPIYLREGKSKGKSLETVAVVEISKMSHNLNMESVSGKLADVFESVDLYTWGKASPSLNLGAMGPFSTQVVRTGAILNTLTEAVCQVQGVLFAQVWGACQGTHLLPPSSTPIASNRRATGKKQWQEMDLLSCDCLPCGVQDSRFIDFRTVSTSSFVCEGQGIVGTAWKKNSSVWYSQISSIPEEGNPYSAFNIRSFNGGMVAIPISLSKDFEESGEAKFVMEIFITELCAGMEEQRRLIVQILSMLLNIGGGRLEIGVLLEYWKPNMPLPLCSPGALAADPTPSPYNNSKGKGSVKFTTSEQVKDNAARKEGATATTAVKKEPRTSSNKKAISMETLQKYFKYNLKEAAKRLGVCPTTLKRVCRQYNIPRWPCRKLKKVNRSISKLQGVVESVPGVNATAIGFPDLKAACVFDTSVELSRDSLNSGGVPAMTSNKGGRGVGVDSSPGSSKTPAGVMQMVGGGVPMQSRAPFSQAQQVGFQMVGQQQQQQGVVPTCGPMSIPSHCHPRAAAYYDMNRAYASCPTGGLLNEDESAAPLAHVGSNHSISYLASPPDPPTLACASHISGGIGGRGVVKGLSVKVAYKEGMMRFTLRPDHSLDCISSKVRNHFGLKDEELRLRYWDDESDLISLKNDDDLLEALESVRDTDSSERQIIRIQAETL
jgi:hypothetical protein